MNKLKNAIFSVLNVLVIVGILVFIMAGLIKIGILEIPAFLQNLFAIEDSSHVNESNDLASDFLNKSQDADTYEFYSASLTPESVKKILSGLKSSAIYAHDVQYSVFSQDNALTKRAYIMKNNDAYCAFYLTNDGNVVKQILNKDGITTVNTLFGNSLKTVSYEGDNVDFAAQTGAILTHEDFFDAADEPGYTFEIKSDDVGTVMLIEFTSQNGSYSQLQKYTLSLDFGIVTEAHCYENDVLIYELTTNSLSKELTPGFVIPKAFADCLPDDFSVLQETSVIKAEPMTAE